MKRGWIGVDLDGTLAHYDGWRGIDKIGEPIYPMKNKIIAWLASGIEVKIFTARANEGEEAIKYIKDWCEEHLGVKLPVTATKDFNMICLYDDRARQVITNQGIIVDAT